MCAHGKELVVDLILLVMENFDVIFGMDWLVAYHDTIHCYSKKVVFRIPGQPEFPFQGVKFVIDLVPGTLPISYGAC